MNMRSYVRMGLSFLACYGAGFLASLFVSTGAGSWYDGLVKPLLTPDKYTVLYVWLAIYALMAAALTIVWEKDPHVDEMRGWVPLFFAHLLVNAAWPMLFFGFHSIFIALIDATILVFAVGILTAGAWEVDKRAGYFLLPYFLWILFTTYLNIRVWFLN